MILSKTPLEIDLPLDPKSRQLLQILSCAPIAPIAMSKGQVHRPVAPWDDTRRNSVPEDLWSKVRHAKDTSTVSTLPSDYPFKRVVHKEKGRLRREDESEKPRQYDISWNIYASSNFPDIRLAQEGNIWVEEQSDGGAIHLCLQRGIWIQWAGNSGRQYVEHPYVHSLIFLFTGKKWRWGAENTLRALRTTWLKSIAESEHDNVRKAIWGSEVVEGWQTKLNLEDFTPAQTIKTWRCQPTRPPLLVPGKGPKKTPERCQRDDAPRSLPLYNTSRRRLSESPDRNMEAKDRQPLEPGSSTPASVGPRRMYKKPNMRGTWSSGNMQTARPRSLTLPGARPQKDLVNSDEEPSTRPHTGASPQKRSITKTVDVSTTSAETDSPSTSQAGRARARRPLADHEQPSRNATSPSKRPASQKTSLGGSSTVSKTGGPPPEKRTRFDLPPAAPQTNVPSAPEGSSSKFRGDPQLLFTPPPESPTSATSARAEPPSPLAGGDCGHPPKGPGTAGNADNDQPAQPPAFLPLTGGAELSNPWVLLERASLRADRNESDNAMLRKKVEALERERDALTQKLYASPSDPTSSPAYRKLLDSYQKLEASQEERLETERKNWEEANGAARRRLEEDVQMLLESQRAAAEYIAILQRLPHRRPVEPVQSSLPDSVVARQRTWSTSNESDDNHEDPRFSQQGASTSRHTDSDGPTSGNVYF